MLTLRTFHSIFKEADKEDTVSFSIHHIHAISARRGVFITNFTKRIDALLPFDLNSDDILPVSGNIVEEDAVIGGRAERTSVTVDDRVCIITENSF